MFWCKKENEEQVDVETQGLLDILKDTTTTSKTKLIRNFNILANEYAQLRTMNSGLPMDASGQAIPWFTYPATDFLSQLDFAGCNVFEYGSGQSTLFWAKRAKNVCSTEADSDWYNKVLSKAPANVQLQLAENAKDYAGSITYRSMLFDVIVVDGIHRYKCIDYVDSHLKNTGFIIFDNSDWYPNCCARLRDMGFIQLDYCGFGPINNYTWCTSFFLRPTTVLKRAQNTISILGSCALESQNIDDQPS